VGDIVDRAGAWSRDGRLEYARDVLDMNAVEHSPRFDDAPRGPRLELVERAPPWSIDAGQTKHLNAVACLLAEGQPPALGHDPRPRSLIVGMRLCRLVDHSALMIAVNAYSRQVTDPVERRETGDLIAVVAEYRISFRAWWNGMEEVCGAGERRHKLGIVSL